MGGDEVKRGKKKRVGEDEMIREKSKERNG